MREIKFRAWDKESKKMYYADSKQFGFEFRGDGEWGYCDYGTKCVYTTKKNGVLMQYTGLKDKNGKKIFEGDIVRHYDHIGDSVEVAGVVEFNIDSYCIKTTNIYAVRWANISAFMADDDFLEVIGNIYEHPELLTKNNDK